MPIIQSSVCEESRRLWVPHPLGRPATQVQGMHGNRR